MGRIVTPRIAELQTGTKIIELALADFHIIDASPVNEAKQPDRPDITCFK